MSTRSRILILIAVLAAVGFGFWYQRESPSEKNRFRHPQAYSVCVPSGWSAEVQYSHGASENDANQKEVTRIDGLKLTPDVFTGTPPLIDISHFSGTPDAKTLYSNGWVDGTFQNQPAFTADRPTKHGYFRGAIFERSGQWFEMSETLTVITSVQKDDWWQFLETFRYPDGTPRSALVAPKTSVTAPASTAPFTFPAVGP